jgi:hypothetical protein
MSFLTRQSLTPAPASSSRQQSALPLGFSGRITSLMQLLWLLGDTARPSRSLFYSDKMPDFDIIHERNFVEPPALML